MNLTTFAQLGRRGRRLVWGGALTGLLLAAGTTAIGDVSPEAKRLVDQRRQSLSLFAGPTAVLQGNQIQCGVDNQGNVCTDVFNSPTGGGGFWPTGSPNQYIFNTGLQIAGIMGPDGGPWANDTVGAFFFDASGTVPSGFPLTNIFNSLDPDDLENWPAEAFISDPALFQEVLVGRKTASQQDSWVQYWDGNPSKISGRQHPMGIQVTQRSLAWNYPAGNEALIYFIYNFENATADADFQSQNEAQFFAGNPALPDAGISLGEIYGAFATDMDVTANAGQNFSTAILPLDLGLSYHGGFSAPEFNYTPDLFFPPFFTNAPGLIGIKYLRSPVDVTTMEQVGLTLFSATLNSSAGFPDPRSDRQLWRYLSGKLNPAQGDFPCNITAEVVSADPNQVQRSLCFLGQTSADTRFYMASGPFDLDPGADATIVVAYIAAATVATLPNGSPSGIIANASDDSANPPGVPSFHPGFPSARGCATEAATSCTEVDNSNPVKIIERGAGWVSYSGPAPASRLESPTQKLDQNLITTVPLSLMGRSLVAQTIFDNRFLLAFAPEQPVFFLVPGDGQVVVVWEPSISEDTNGDGDPFFQVASDSTSPLFNPNFRQFDVEGYRVFRGTSAGNLQLIAQFDFANTTFTDVTCETVLPSEDIGNTIPGFVAGEVCPDSLVKVSNIDEDLLFNNGGAGGQPGAGVFRLADSTAAFNGAPISAVTSDDAGPVLPLADTGVPFVYTDTDVTNNFTYFYAVSAFDVNSAASGPSTLQSARVTQNTVPRADAPNLVNAQLVIGIAGDDGEVLTPSASAPTVSSSDGTFAGPFPPTDAYSLSFAPLVPRLLPTLTLEVTIDSIVARATGNILSGTQEFPPTATGFCTYVDVDGVIASAFGACWDMFLSVNRDGAVTPVVVNGHNPWWNAFGTTGTFVIPLLNQPIAFDQDALDAFGIPSGTGFATLSVQVTEGLNNSASEGAQNRRFGNFHTGARWFDGNSSDGAVETVADPSKYRRVGHVNAADTIFAPIAYTPIDASDADPNSVDGAIMFSRQCYNRALGFLDRAADIVFTWSGGTLTARDVTHNVDVRYNPDVGPTWGFLTTDANGNGVIDWHDFNYVGPTGIQVIRQVDGGNCNAFAGTTFDAGLTATPVSLSSSPAIMPTSTNLNLNVDLENGAALPQTGTGFGLFVDGHRFIFEMDALPADGTAWTFRSFMGGLTTSSGADTDDPGGYALDKDVSEGFASTADLGPVWPMQVPGLTFQYTVAAGTNFRGPVDLTQVHTVPDPYLGSSLFDRGPTTKQLMFVNLPENATIRIYTLTGVLVDVLVHDDVTGGGREVWDIRNRNNQFVASGVYFFHVMTPTGEQHVGKFTIINQAGSN